MNRQVLTSVTLLALILCQQSLQVNDINNNSSNKTNLRPNFLQKSSLSTINQNQGWINWNAALGSICPLCNIVGGVIQWTSPNGGIHKFPQKIVNAWGHIKHACTPLWKAVSNQNWAGTYPAGHPVDGLAKNCLAQIKGLSSQGWGGNLEITTSFVLTLGPSAELEDVVGGEVGAGIEIIADIREKGTVLIISSYETMEITAGWGVMTKLGSLSGCAGVDITLQEMDKKPSSPKGTRRSFSTNSMLDAFKAYISKFTFSYATDASASSAFGIGVAVNGEEAYEIKGKGELSQVQKGCLGIAFGLGARASIGAEFKIKEQLTQYP